MLSPSLITRNVKWINQCKEHVWYRIFTKNLHEFFAILILAIVHTLYINTCSVYIRTVCFLLALNLRIQKCRKNDPLYNFQCIVYRIVTNFRERKLLRFGRNEIFVEKTFADCLLVSLPKMPHPPILRRKLSTKPWNSWKFSPLKVSRYTVITDSNREASSVSGEDDSSYCGALLKDAINKNDDDEDDDETLLQSRPFSTDSWVFGLHWLCIPEQECIRTGG